jgi:hypothetical protein
MGLDPFRGQPDHGRQRADDPVENQVASGRLAMQVQNYINEFHAIEPDNGQDGAELDENDEGILLATGESEPILGQDQVACR